MKLNCIVVDDDRYSQQSVAQCVEITEFLNLVGIYGDAVEAWSGLKQNSVDLIFLDVEMPGLSGLEFVRNLEEVPQIILVTGKKEYAFEGFELDVTDFLVKPLEYKRFLKAAEKALRNHQESLERDSASDHERPHIFVKSDQELKKVFLSEILYLEAVGDYVKIYTTEGRLMVLSTLKSFEAKLPEDTFTRVHRSYLLNLSRIEKVVGNKVFIKDREVPVSRSYKSALKDRLKLFAKQ